MRSQNEVGETKYPTVKYLRKYKEAGHVTPHKPTQRYR